MGHATEKELVRPRSLTVKKKRKKRNLRWESLIDTFEAGDFLVVPLTCSNELRDEGESMYHCIGRHYHRWCYDGAIRVFSVRDLDGKRLATASIYFDFNEMRWRFEQCKGYANQTVCELTFENHAYGWELDVMDPPELHFLTQEIVRIYQLAEDAQSILIDKKGG